MAQLELKIGDKTYNKAWIDNLSSTSQISSDPASVNYGVIPSTGNATMRDNGGHIKNGIENGVLPVSNAPTKVIINGNQIQDHITSDSDYNIIDKKLNLQFSDRLSMLDKVTYGGMPLREYQMTAYEMLDDVIGSYGDYCKERVVNWIKYQNATAIGTFGGNYNRINVNTASGWEIIGTSIKVVPNKQYNLAYSITTNTEYTTIKGDGIPLQVLNSVPTNSDCTSIELAHAYMSKTKGSNVGTITFTPTTDVVYLVLNFGYASDNISSISFDINSLSLNENSLSNATANNNNYIRRKLEDIKIEYPYLPSASYRETIEKFCVLAQCSCALDEDGHLNFYNSSPTLVDSDTTISVPNSYKISNLNKTLFLKNKIDGVDIKQSKVTSRLDYNSLCANWVVDSITDYQNNAKNESDQQSSSSGATVYFKTYYTSFNAKIPKKTADGLKDIERILTGTNTQGNPFVKWNVSWTYQYFSFSGGVTSSNISTLLSTEETGDIVNAQFLNADSPQQVFADTMSITRKLLSQQTITASCDDNSNTTTSPNLFRVSVEDSGKEYWVANITLLVGKEARDAESDGTGYGGRFIPHSVTISFYGDVKEIVFDEVDCSSKGIESAVTPVSIPTNELMQNLSDVRAIKNNILADYRNGIPTARIDLSCGLGDWETGQILQPNDVIQLANEEGKWRVTSRTFKYKGAPTLSLELQKQSEKTWHDVYTMGRVFSASPANHLGEIDISSKVFLPYPTKFNVTVTFGIQKDGVDRNDKTDKVWFDVPGRNQITASTYYVGLSSVTCHLSYDQENGIILYDAPKETRSISIGSDKGDWVAYTKKIDISVQQYY